ncbi:MAG TPA: ABC transporter ATP-binding protein [Steroidobacteraceae bacterium]|jgi:iron complex transport system ATP-binding protein|nr:ABC transporter ATP-binding protein [Steroidobacteraceae bacterium]
MAIDPVQPTPLSVAGLSIAAGERTLVQDLSFELHRGEFLAILGRNGSGKTLTLHALAGLNGAHGGRVLLDGEDLGAMPRRRIARRLGLLLQDREESLALSALESALIGRHPHLKFWQREGAQDLAIAQAALRRVGLADFARRSVATLSGGEQRRAAMASLLTQQPQIFLLDEPTNHLDPHHQIEVLDVFRALCREGASVIATLHDPTLAERYADRALLLYGDSRYRLGPVADVLTAEELSALYLTPICAIGAPPRRAFIAA